MQQARSSEQKVADKKKIIKSAADSATFDPKSLLSLVAVVQHLQTDDTHQLPPSLPVSCPDLAYTCGHSECSCPTHKT
jgi:hypothetical protein